MENKGNASGTNHPRSADRPDVQAGDHDAGAFEPGTEAAGTAATASGIGRGNDGSPAAREQGSGSDTQASMSRAGTGQYVSREAADPDLADRHADSNAAMIEDMGRGDASTDKGPNGEDS